jgi:Methyltransferase domain
VVKVLAPTRRLRERLPTPLWRWLRAGAIGYHAGYTQARRLRKRTMRIVWRRYHAHRFGESYATTIEHLPTRDQLPLLLNRRRLCGIGVEVGVQRGRYSELLLSHWQGRKLVSVDPWREDAPEAYVDRANVPQDVQEQLFAETRDRLQRFGCRSEIWRLASHEAAALIEDGSLDFVYLDGRHDYRSVLADLDDWWPKLRPGGIIAGHDYVDGSFPNGEFEVRRAVDEFFADRRLQVHSTDGRPAAVEIFPSWIVEVPEDQRVKAG